MVDVLRLAHPTINFKPSDKFAWDPIKKIIYFSSNEPEAIQKHSLLHELAHAMLDHSSYKNDVQLIKMERDAWTLAKKMLREHSQEINLDYIEDCLDTYRDWIYSRSKCPRCSHVGIQSSQNVYSCIFCIIDWKVTESRLCMVKRKIM
jgi:hypothetical protein